MQQRSFEAIRISDETPSSGHTIIWAFVHILSKNSCPNDVHHNRKGPEERTCCQTEKTTDVKHIPTADEGGEEYSSGHSFPKANSGKGMNRDNRVPRSRLSWPLRCKAKVSSPYSTSDITKSDKTSLHPTSHSIFNSSQVRPSCLD